MTGTESVLTVTGDIESALTHFAGFGVAAIVAEQTGIRPRLRWSRETAPRLQLDLRGLSVLDAADAVRAHACSRAQPENWVQQKIEYEGKSGVGLFSPRIKVASTRASTIGLQSARQNVLAELELAPCRLDLEMIAGLGEPGYWCFVKGEPRPDHAASRWEMKARNKGEEFVGNRLAPMARALGDRTSEGILDGLNGLRVVDELGAGPMSQTGTGLCSPGEVDTAVAWCALWGLASFPVIHDAHGPSRTPCAFPPRVLHTRWMVLPVSESWMSLRLLRDLLLSSPCAVYGASLVPSVDRGSEDGSASSAAGSWLAAHGVSGFVRFPVQKAGSASAPQRFVLRGELVALAGKSGE